MELVFYLFIICFTGCTSLQHIAYDYQFPVIVSGSDSLGKEVCDFDAAHTTSKAYLLFSVDDLSVSDLNYYEPQLRKLNELFEVSQHAFDIDGDGLSCLDDVESKYTTTNLYPGGLSNLSRADFSKNALLAFHLPDTFSDRAEYLAHVDRTIASVVHMAQEEHMNVVTIIASRASRHREPHVIVRRAAGVQDTSNYYKLDCFKLYVSSDITLQFSKTVAVKLAKTYMDSNASACANSTTNGQRAVIVWKNIDSSSGQLERASLTLDFTRRLGSWKLSAASVAAQGTLDGRAVSVDGAALRVDDAGVSAPLGFSYHCTKTRWSGKKPADSLAAILLPGLQLQPFTTRQQTAFGRPWDCAAFFTVPILSGILLSLILLSVLAWSLIMLGSVPTMDKWDDSRTKPLHIHTAD